MPDEKKYSIVTGANSGIGREVAAGLMAAGHHVVLACRNQEACEVAAAALAAAQPRGSCECSRIDLEDLGSVRAFAARHRAALRRERRALSVLVNNAGLMGPPNRPDGADRHLWANHLGPYLLTRLLVPAFDRKGGGRVVNVASRAHYLGSVKVAREGGGGGGGGGLGGDEAAGGGGGGGWRIEGDPGWWFWQYARSKLCNVLFTRELQQRHPHVASSSVSPGFVGTAIFSNLPWPARLLAAPARALARTPEQGAATAVWAATAEEAGGMAPEARLFLHDCAPLKPSALALDAELSRALWEASARAVGIHPDRDD